MRELTRKEREKERIRQEILEAAEEEFARSGFRDTNMSAIAARVELSVGTLYNFFSSKNALFIALMEAKTDDLFSRQEEMVQAVRCPLEKIRLIVRQFIETMLDNLRLFRLINEVHREGSMPAIEKEHPMFLRFENHFLLLVRLFEEAIVQGKVRPIPASFLAVCLDSLLFGMVKQMDRMNGLKTADEIIVLLESVFLDGILVKEKSCQ